MILTFLPWLLNHLWQSTVCAGIAGLLALALRKNSASVRYRIWFAASVKFLIPFSVLVSLGGQFPWRTASAVPVASSGAAIAESSEILPPSPPLIIDRIARPLALAAPVAAPAPALPSTTPAPFRIAIALLIVWFCGFAFSVFAWLRQWLGIRAKVQAATPLEWDLPMRIPVMSSSASIEPSVFGIFHPVLLLPKGISDDLPPAQMEAILLHESVHVRRRDNLGAALHMVVETIFWFHPLVWWIGKRLVEERENACDEEVLGGPGEPGVYAEAILNVCKLHLKTPLACMAGVASSNLRQRIEGIMNHRNPWKLNFGKRLLLLTTSVVALCGPVFIGLVTARQVQSPAPAVGSSNFATIDLPGSSSTVARGISSLGRIVGSYVNDTGTHGFLLSNGIYTTIDVPGSAWTVATGINNVGQIVGSFGPGGDSGNHGFLLSGGNFASFDFPGSLDTIANGLNNNGQIVGSYLGNDGLRHGFRLSGGTYSLIEFPESRAGSAEAINDAGQIVGLSGSGATAVGFLYSGGSYSKIQYSRDAFANAKGLNNLGDIVGQDGGPQAPFRGFVRNGEKYSLIEVPGFPIAWDGLGINDLGQIVGAYTDSDGRTRGYLATPMVFRSPPGTSDSQLPKLLTDATNPDGLRGPVGPQGPQGPPGPPGPPGDGARGRGRGGRGQAVVTQFGWRGRNGRTLGTVGSAKLYGDFDVSPDGARIAVTVLDDAANGNIEVMESQRPDVPLQPTAPPIQLTRGSGNNFNPVWSPDGNRIAFTSNRNGNSDIFLKNANGEGGEMPLLSSPFNESVEDWSKDGRYVAYLYGQNEFQDIYVLPIGGGKAFPVVQGNFHKDEPQFSYDGRWLAYTSDESGRFEVYVVSFPSGDQKTQVTVNGGGRPRWRQDGNELFYMTEDTVVMSVSVNAAEKFEVGLTRQLFRNRFPPSPATRHRLGVSPDGQRFFLRVE